MSQSQGVKERFTNDTKQEYCEELKEQILGILPPMVSWVFAAVCAALSLQVSDRSPERGTGPHLGPGPVVQTLGLDLVFSTLGTTSVCPV